MVLLPFSTQKEEKKHCSGYIWVDSLSADNPWQFVLQLIEYH